MSRPPCAASPNSCGVNAVGMYYDANGTLILSLAARRKGIARFAVLHLDCARSAEGGPYRFALEKQLRF
jgi:hypothetical protein